MLLGASQRLIDLCTAIIGPKLFDFSHGEFFGVFVVRGARILVLSDLHHVVSVAEADDRKEAVPGQRSDEQLESLARHLVSHAPHAPTAVHDEDKVEAAPIVKFDLLWSCFFVSPNRVFLRFQGIEGGRNGERHSHFVLVWKLSVQERRNHHVGRLEENVHDSAGFLALKSEIAIVRRRLELGAVGSDDVLDWARGLDLCVERKRVVEAVFFFNAVVVVVGVESHRELVNEASVDDSEFADDFGVQSESLTREHLPQFDAHAFFFLLALGDHSSLALSDRVFISLLCLL